MSPSPPNTGPSPSAGSSDSQRASRVRRILAASHSWQTLLAALVAGAAAIFVAVLPGGGSGGGGDSPSPSPSEKSQSEAFVNINTITQTSVLDQAKRVIVTLAGDYGGLRQGWAVYAFGQEQTPRGASATSASWKVQQATVDPEKEKWTAKFTIDKTPVTMHWSAAFGPESTDEESCCPTETPGEPSTSAPSTSEPSAGESSRHEAAEAKENLRLEGPRSDLAVAPAPTKTTVITPAP
ncbi:hypothetical protein SCNRRL3882_4021 [Streptomyces chartreusis NRRL 3882]|uniref:Uncharacterized protein n=1 Tax=Streptomyces chartreusis NRRL 3882 TaxID=1079985 RepID=A0A2N9BB35_STRCX|nr:hypothetical protein SCNRRL3882_4021 [Streptomyces chartreusis NRRL 3882]